MERFYAAGGFLLSTGIAILIGGPAGVLEEVPLWRELAIVLLALGTGCLVIAEIAAGRKRRRIRTLSDEVATAEEGSDLADLTMIIADAQADRPNKVYFLEVAEAYNVDGGNQVRVDQLRGEIAQIDARVEQAQAQIAAIHARRKR